VPKIEDVLAKKGREVATISPDATVLEAANLMNTKKIGAVCITEGDALLGVFTERDILNRVVSAQRDPATTKLAEVMTTSPITCGLNGKTGNCVAAMSHERIRHLPVVEDGKLVGIISTGDLMALEADENQAFIENLYQYLHGLT
jgi:CBS domain-containing protein